jgi:hypothetical protein
MSKVKPWIWRGEGSGRWYVEYGFLGDEDKNWEVFATHDEAVAHIEWLYGARNT